MLIFVVPIQIIICIFIFYFLLSIFFAILHYFSLDIGAAYGTAKSGVGIASMGVMHPGLVMKNIIPVVMAGVLGIYGLIVAVIIQGSSKINFAIAANNYSFEHVLTNVTLSLCINNWVFSSCAISNRPFLGRCDEILQLHWVCSFGGWALLWHEVSECTSAMLSRV